MQVKIKGDFMQYYDPVNDCLLPDCPLRCKNAKLIFIDEDEVVFEVEEGFSKIVRLNGVGDIEEVIFE